MRYYLWEEEATFLILPYFGFSWGPERTPCIFFGWLFWVGAIFFSDPNTGSYIHTHHGKAALT